MKNWRPMPLLCTDYKILSKVLAAQLVGRAIRQGCSLSGMLYSLAIEPFSHRLRLDLRGVQLPGCPAPFKVTAYADDVMVLVNSEIDVDVWLS
ncbi:hypothetical protein WMY93_010045 [Mugilogobius chulae]|uniref:Reverse transcriptase domain-containing protein n=1 Tax=Mugilogobius chulae TaxID=88201 RepID=A0AAW0PHR4_9GOBI